jgi:hypothetical protein
MESRSSISNTSHNDVDKRNPYEYKVDAEALNRHRRRFSVRPAIYHIYQGQ